MSGPLRILQVVDKAPHEGGVPSHVATLTAGLRECGQQVDVLRIGPEAGTGGADLPATYGVLPGLVRQGRLARLLEALRPQVIHLQGCFTTLSPILIRRMRRAAVVVATLHDVRPFCYLMTRRFRPTGEPCQRRCGIGCLSSGCVPLRGPTEALRWTRRWAMDGLHRRAWAELDALLVPSSYLRDLALAHGMPEARLHLVPHGTPLPEAAPGGPRPPTILYVGSLSAEKGGDVLVDALIRLAGRPWSALFIGDGPLRAPLRERIERAGLGGQVVFAGHVDDPHALARHFAEARLLVLPSLLPESFGLVGIEALAAATPVVSFGLGGQREWLRDGDNGLLARVADPVDLAAQIARLLDAPELAAEMGKRGRALVAERFQVRQMANTVLRVYTRLLDARRPY